MEDFNLTVKKGEFVTFLGPSGCGKTTTLRMIAGFEFPTEGEILLNGEDISHIPPNLRPINTVFQRYALFPHLNVYENVAFGLNLKKLPKSVIREKVRRVLEVVDLEDSRSGKISTLSGGQQQRIAIARAIVNEPDILLLDEPLGALDLKMRQEMQLELKSMHEQLGITFIYVTHDQEEALTMSDKVVVMSDGMIQQIGTPEEIYNEPKKRLCRRLHRREQYLRGGNDSFHDSGVLSDPVPLCGTMSRRIPGGCGGKAGRCADHQTGGRSAEGIVDSVVFQGYVL